jgi:hypothetical protein
MILAGLDSAVQARAGGASQQRSRPSLRGARLAGEGTALGSVLRIEGVQPTAMAVFDGALFVGTEDGQVHRALAAR